jgi:hypothetical protein
MPKRETITQTEPIMPTLQPANNTGGMSWPTKITIAVAVLLIVGASGSAGYFYKKLNDVKKDPTQAAQQETDSVVAAVGKLIVLPTGEKPTLATVTDPEKLKDQPFFANAKAGYKVLIYTNAKKAILYDPTANKIVEVAPVNIGNTNQSNQSNVSGSSTADTSTGASSTDTTTTSKTPLKSSTTRKK